MIYKPTDITNPLEIKSLFCLYLQHFGQGYAFSGELHDFWECVYVVDGEVCISSDERMYYLQKGDIVFHKPQEFHKFHIENPSGATLLDFSFLLDGDFAERMEGKVCRLTKKQNAIMLMFVSYLKEEFNNHPEAKNKFYFYNALPVFKNDPVILQTIRLYILQLILSLSKDEIPIKTVETSETVLLKQAIEEMNKCIERSLSITDLAKTLNISLSGLKRLFKKHTGTSVYKYYLTLKTRTATTMLRSGMTVSEVANKLGFSSPAYFSATYKREAGKNPSEEVINI